MHCIPTFVTHWHPDCTDFSINFLGSNTPEPCQLVETYVYLFIFRFCFASERIRVVTSCKRPDNMLFGMCQTRACQLKLKTFLARHRIPFGKGHPTHRPSTYNCGTCARNCIIHNDNCCSILILTSIVTERTPQIHLWYCHSISLTDQLTDWSESASIKEHNLTSVKRTEFYITVRRNNAE